jgi:hypothetical protein
MPRITVAAAPRICATMRPAKEIQAERTLSFFFSFSCSRLRPRRKERALARGTLRRCRVWEGGPDAAPGCSLSIRISPRVEAPIAARDREPDLLHYVRVEEIGGRLTLRHCRMQHDRHQHCRDEGMYEARYRISSHCGEAWFSGAHASHIPPCDRDCLRPARRSLNRHKAGVISRAQGRCDPSTWPVESAIVLPRLRHRRVILLQRACSSVNGVED